LAASRKSRTHRQLTAMIVLKLIAMFMKREIHEVIFRDQALPFERNYKYEGSNCDEERSRKKTAAGQHGNSQR
jgi:hypothetical protein